MCYALSSASSYQTLSIKWKWQRAFRAHDAILIFDATTYCILNQDLICYLLFSQKIKNLWNFCAHSGSLTEKFQEYYTNFSLYKNYSKHVGETVVQPEIISFRYERCSVWFETYWACIEERPVFFFKSVQFHVEMVYLISLMLVDKKKNYMWINVQKIVF